MSKQPERHSNNSYYKKDETFPSHYHNSNYTNSNNQNISNHIGNKRTATPQRFNPTTYENAKNHYCGQQGYLHYQNILPTHPVQSNQMKQQEPPNNPRVHTKTVSYTNNTASSGTSVGSTCTLPQEKKRKKEQQRPQEEKNESEGKKKIVKLDSGDKKPNLKVDTNNSGNNTNHSQTKEYQQLSEQKSTIKEGSLSSSPSKTIRRTPLQDKEALKRVYENVGLSDEDGKKYTFSVLFKCTSLEDNEEDNDELIQITKDDDGNDYLSINGNILFNQFIENNNVEISNIENFAKVVSSEEKFYQFVNQLHRLSATTDDFSFQDFIDLVDNSVLPSSDRMANDKAKWATGGLIFDYDLSKINIKFENNKNKNNSRKEEIAKYLVSILDLQSEEEEDEIQEEEESTNEVKENISQVTYNVVLDITLTGPTNKSIVTNFDIQISKENENCLDENFFKLNITSQLYIQLSDISLFKITKKDVEKRKVECSFSIPITAISQNKLKVDIRLASRHVYFEQRAISYELFKRLKEIIGEERCKEFTELSFLICSPNQNTLWNQNVKRLYSTDLIPLLMEEEQVKKIAIKYMDDHVSYYNDIRKRIKKERTTLFVIIADECHFAITKGKSHDKIINDFANNGSILKEADNLFVLLVSATPYNVISADSNIPERYIVKSDWEVLDKNKKLITIPQNTIISVCNSTYSKTPNGLLIRKRSSNTNNEKIYFLPNEKSSILRNVEVLGDIKNLIEFDSRFENGDLIIREKSNLIRKATDLNVAINYNFKPRETQKIRKSNIYFLLNNDYEELTKDTLVELYDSIHWTIDFKIENDIENKEYSVNDWKFNIFTKYEELNVINWKTVQENIGKEKLDTKTYFSKQDYIDTMLTNNSSVKYDQLFESLLNKVKNLSSLLKPLLLAIDYHFWFQYYLYHQKKLDVNKFYKLFMDIDTIKQLSKIQLPQITISKIIYLINFIKINCKGKKKEKEKIIEKLEELLEELLEENDDDMDSLENETKKIGLKEKREKLLKLITEKSIEFNKFIKVEENIIKQLFEQSIINLSVDHNNHTKSIIDNLLNSCKVKNELKGEMKIIRITSQEYAVSVYNMLKYSVSQLVLLQNEQFILPDILIDTGKTVLNLDQLSMVTRLKLAKEKLSEASYEKYKNGSTKIKKSEKNLEYINLQNFPCILLLVQKGRQGDTFPSSFNCLDMRAKGEGRPIYSSFTQEFGRLCRYMSKDEKRPIALVPGSVYSLLYKTAKPKTSSLQSTKDSYNNHSIMKLDKYIIKRERYYKPQKYWNIVTTCRRVWKAVGERRRKNQEASPPSYDHNRAPNGNLIQKVTHKNRILLFAEPQIGKTDSFLHFLERLKSEIAFNRLCQGIDDNVNDMVVDNEKLITTDKECINMLEWNLPYHGRISKLNMSPYEDLTPGKYTKLVFKHRKDIFDSSELETNRYNSFIRQISLVESLSLNSNYYIQKIKALESKVNDEKSCITFDGRFLQLYNSKTLKYEKGNNTPIPILNSNKPTKSLNYQDRRYVNTGLTTTPKNKELKKGSESKIYNVDSLLFENYFKKSKLRFSIPDDKKSLFKFNNKHEINGMDKLEDKFGIKYWIFMPSYNRSTTGLFFFDSLDKATYGQVIVVRESEFNNYVDALGKYCVIMSLPREIDSKTIVELFKNNNLIEDFELRSRFARVFKDTINGIGFSRLAIQIISYIFELEFIWMIDDTCHHFEKIDFTNQKQKVSCSMFEVMTNIERIVDDKQPLKSIYNISSNIQNLKKRSNPGQLLHWNDPIEEFTPGREDIAMIGIRKDGYRYVPTLNYHPFIISNTICSFFLLNVKSTFTKGAFFPARIYQEDIEFEYLCKERGLLCLKSQQYFLSKINNPINLDNNSTPIYLHDLFSETCEKISEMCDRMPSNNIQKSKDFENIIEALKEMEKQDNRIIIFYNEVEVLDKLNSTQYSTFYFCCSGEILKASLKSYVNIFKNFVHLSAFGFKREVRSIKFYSPQNLLASITELIICVECA